MRPKGYIVYLFRKTTFIILLLRVQIGQFRAKFWKLYEMDYMKNGTTTEKDRLDYALRDLQKRFSGEIYHNHKWLTIYATDASAYKEKPLAVAFPKNNEDIKVLIAFARQNNTFLIPRTAGTSLAGQVVGNGIVVDVSKYMNKILDFNKEERWILVEPGVVLDELNLFTAPHGLFFGPETSTSNRCMIGGMVGNNACGAHSVIYGSTRDHIIEVSAILSDGSEALFGELDTLGFNEKLSIDNKEGNIYRDMHALLQNPGTLARIDTEFPDPRIKRRNTGYALDILTQNDIFRDNHQGKFNFCKLLAGSEGTLAFTNSVKLNLIPLPPKNKGVVCIHFKTLEEALQANLLALKYNPGAIEMIDDVIIKCTESNIEQKKNRVFIEGTPAAVLIVEFARESIEEIKGLKDAMETEMRAKNYGYHFPLLFNQDINKVWALRKAGLGLLSNVPGDAKPVSVIEDTAVHPEFLPLYIADIKKMLSQLGLDCVYHAHIATGELHLRPVIDLKTKEGVALFYTVAEKTAHLVKKYRGSLSGEHGDGRLRGQFIPIIIGDANFMLLKETKKIWDPEGVFNQGKIVETPKMNESLRYIPGAETKLYETAFDFSKWGGIARTAEKCNGSGDCRKTELIGGTMCPSYMATRDEDKTTRARANMLRETLIHSKKANPFDDKDLFNILELCLSCKGCKNECPSSVDMATLKSEFLFQYYKTNRIPLRTRAIAYISRINQMASILPPVFNFMVSQPIVSHAIKAVLGFSQKRTIPKLYKTTLKKWARKHLPSMNASQKSDSPSVCLFMDEFSNFNDTEIGIKTIKLLHALGYKVLIKNNAESGRTYISKGFLEKARHLAITNVELYHGIVNDKTPLLGIEPSAILTFRDEYPDLLTGAMKEKAQNLARNVLMVDEFFAREIEKGRIKTSQFTQENKTIKLHGHCQQKAVASTQPMIKMLSLPENFRVTEIKSGCCGMAGSFGYEKEHYGLSIKVGELVLFPEIRNSEKGTVFSAPGTSCRHHISDGTGTKALHPIEILYDALVAKPEQ
jgi:FAD/FMN-containing dehydrogenase/Fe-S oxidoreductase